MNNWIPSITWGAIEHIWYMPLLIIAIGLLLYRLRYANKAVQLLAAGVLGKQLLRNYSYNKNKLKLVLLSFGLLFLFIALLKPQWDTREELVVQEGRDLFIAFDVSRSMLAQDLEPSRLEFAKNKVRSLLKKLSCERVGLMLFSGSTFIQCPLTADYAAFQMFLDQVDVETISSGTTALDQAIKKALETFKKMPNKKHKLLVLLTDGEDFSSNLAGVKRQALKENLSIFTIGVGTPEGAPIPLFDNHGHQAGHQKDKRGNVVISRLNEGILSGLAGDSGGLYLRATSDDSDVKAIVKRVQQFEKERIEDKKLSVAEQQYPYFLLVSLACFALEWLL